MGVPKTIANSLLILTLSACLSNPSSDVEPLPLITLDEDNTASRWANRPENFTKLRNEIGWSKNYRQSCQNDRPSRSIGQSLNKAKWREAVEEGLTWLEKCPIDIGIHYYVSIGFEQLGNQEQAEHHWLWVEGLMDSIIESGDGKTPKTAYVTISISEEYDALLIFGLKRVSQALVRGDKPLDAITAKNDAGEEFTIYFSPDAHFARLAEMFAD